MGELGTQEDKRRTTRIVLDSKENTINLFGSLTDNVIDDISYEGMAMIGAEPETSDDKRTCFFDIEFALPKKERRIFKICCRIMNVSQSKAGSARYGLLIENVMCEANRSNKKVAVVSFKKYIDRLTMMPRNSKC